MDSSLLEGLVLDPSKTNKLSIEEKREIVYELAKWSNGAPEMLLTWSRQDILQILCTEMGKERKYTGLTKLKIIENLLKLVSEKNSQGIENQNSEQRALKKQRKNEHPTNDLTEKIETEVLNVIYCKNLACKAKLSLKDRFCKRCSCCICRKYDDNKDPSLWLTCCSDQPYDGDSCGFSFHLECALRSGKSRIAKDGMDGCFCCVYCGKLKDLLGCWRKQMITAKETRRVDILCYRISLSQKLLFGTKRYLKLYEIIEEAKSKLEDDVGPLTGLPVKMARGIVNRLSSGSEVQRLCGLALESLDSSFSEMAFISSNHFGQEPNMEPWENIHLEAISSSSATVILDSKNSNSENISHYTIWHCKAEDRNYSEEPTCTLNAPSSSYFLSDLIPATDYIIKVISFENSTEVGTFEVQFQTRNSENEIPNSNNTIISSSLSNPSSVEDENNNIIIPNEKEKMITMNTNSIKDLQASNDTQSGPENEPHLPITPCKLEILKGNLGKKERTKPNKKSNLDEGNLGNANTDFEYYVKVIRWLECEGHIEMNFRQKFLTWYSLRATPQEVRVVKVFVDTLVDDPISLAGQLVDSFSETISSKKSSNVPLGFCMKFWHGD